MSKTILVLGASLNPNRYSHMAVERLLEKGYSVIPVGLSEGEIRGCKIVRNIEGSEDIHTLSMYLNEDNQSKYEDAIIKMKPNRVIFNPGGRKFYFNEPVSRIWNRVPGSVYPSDVVCGYFLKMRLAQRFYFFNI